MAWRAPGRIGACESGTGKSAGEKAPKLGTTSDLGRKTAEFAHLAFLPFFAEDQNGWGSVRARDAHGGRRLSWVRVCVYM